MNPQHKETEASANAEETKFPQHIELNAQELQKVSGGSSLIGGSNLSVGLDVSVGISSSTSGTYNGESYSSTDSHQVDISLGNILNNTNI